MKKILFAMYLIAFSALAVASPGHDHGDEAPLVESEASPRVVMESDLFEAVAILKGQTFEIFVDHAATVVSSWHDDSRVEQCHSRIVTY